MKYPPNDLPFKVAQTFWCFQAQPAGLAGLGKNQHEIHQARNLKKRRR